MWLFHMLMNVLFDGFIVIILRALHDVRVIEISTTQYDNQNAISKTNNQITQYQSSLRPETSQMFEQIRKIN